MPGKLSHHGFSIVYSGDDHARQAFVCCHGGYKSWLFSRSRHKDDEERYRPARAFSHTRVSARAGRLVFFAVHGRYGVETHKSLLQLMGSDDPVATKGVEPEVFAAGSRVVNYVLCPDNPTIRVANEIAMVERSIHPVFNYDLITVEAPHVGGISLRRLWMALAQAGLNYDSLYCCFCRVPIRTRDRPPKPTVPLDIVWKKGDAY